MAACGYGDVAPVPMPAPMPDSGDCEDCVQVVKTTKRVRVPCHRNAYKQYTVKVPRQVNERVARTVNYTDMENRTKQVPYQTTRQETRMKVENQTYQVPVTKTTTKNVTVTRKVPKTVYVDVVTQECRPHSYTVMENRSRPVKIPYTVPITETRYRTVNEQVPVQRSKVVYDNVSKTVYDTQVRTRCEPQVTYVTKEVPVYNVVAKQPAPCATGDCGSGGASTLPAPINPGYGGGSNIDPGFGVNPPATTLPAPVNPGYGGGGYGGASTLPAPAYGGGASTLPAPTNY